MSNGFYIKTYLNELLTQQAERTKLTGDQVISELAAIASFQLTDVIELSNGKLTIKEMQAWSDTAKQAVESLKIDKDGCIHIKAHSKVAALKQLGEHFGLFIDYNTALQALVKYGYVTWLEDGRGFQFRESLEDGSFPNDGRTL
jgi:hypothetical protein